MKRGDLIVFARSGRPRLQRIAAGLEEQNRAPRLGQPRRYGSAAGARTDNNVFIFGGHSLSCREKYPTGVLKFRLQAAQKDLRGNARLYRDRDREDVVVKSGRARTRITNTNSRGDRAHPSTMVRAIGI
jgi:hypothetical protein